MTILDLLSPFIPFSGITDVIPPPPVVATGRDYTIIADIAARLEALGQLSTVLWPEPLEAKAISADRSPLANIDPWPGEIPETPWATMGGQLHQWRAFAARIVLVVRDESADERYRIMDRLRCAISNTLSGQRLGGITSSGFTRVVKTGPDQLDPPERACTLRVEAPYTFYGDDGRDDVE